MCWEWAHATKYLQTYLGAIRGIIRDGERHFTLSILLYPSLSRNH